MIDSKRVVFILIIVKLVSSVKYPPAAPYVDITLGKPSLVEVLEATGQNVFTLAFVLGSAAGCDPKWGGTINLDDPAIISKIRDLQSRGGEVIVATGGAAGPYLENLCTTVESLADAYGKILDTLKTNRLDIDIEASVPLETVTQALAKVQRQRGTTVSFTLMVQGDEYGLTDILGVEVLKASKKNGLRVDIVNPMTMEFGSDKPIWGEACISAAKAVLRQMKGVWPEFSDQQLKKMLGVTPMIGRNFNGKIFQPSDAKLLVNWAISNQIGLLAFWSVSRDNGVCPGGAISPSCSSIQQSEYEFTKLFKQFTDNVKPDGDSQKPKPDGDIQKPNNTTESPNSTTDSTDSTPATTESVPKEKICTARSEDRFKQWCKDNCAAGFCPESFCVCN